jgi:hypothetical protein
VLIPNYGDSRGEYLNERQFFHSARDSSVGVMKSCSKCHLDKDEGNVVISLVCMKGGQ